MKEVLDELKEEEDDEQGDPEEEDIPNFGLVHEAST